MGATVDSLDIKLTSNFDNAIADIDRLEAKLKSLQGTLDKVNGVLGKLSNSSKLPKQMQSFARSADKANDSVKKFGGGLSDLNLFATIQNLQELTQAINFVADAFSAALSEAMEWDGIQARFGRAFADDAKETYEYVNKLSDIMGINVQSFMQYSSMYGSLLSGFGVVQEKATTMSIGLSELTYDLWAANNDVVKRYEDVATAVKSAITGEIEPIRNLGVAMTEASMQEFIDSTHLAGISIENLTEAQKAEVRYAVMVNSAMNQGIVGTYAKEMDTAEGAVRSLSQSFKGLVQAFGSLFIPLLQVAIPYVTAFVEILTDAVRAVAGFFGIEIQKIDWSGVNKGVGGLADKAVDSATGLGSAAKAAKKLKDYTMGFDELNVIDPNAGSSGGSGGAKKGGAADWGTGLELDTLWDDAVFAEASKRVDEIKQKIKDFAEEWKWAFAIVGTVMTGFMAHKVWNLFKNSTFGAALITGIGKVKHFFEKLFGVIKGGSTVSETFAKMFPRLSGFITKVLTPVRTLAGFLGLPVWSAFLWIVTTIVSVAVFLYRNWNDVTDAVRKFFKENIVPKLEEIKKHFDKLFDALGPVKDIFTFLKDKVLPGVADAFEIVGGIIFSVVGGVIATAFNVFMGLVENTMQNFSGIVQVVRGVIDLVVAIFTKGDVGAAWKKIWDGVKDIIKGAVGAITQPIQDIYNGAISWFSNLYTELTGKKLPDIINGVKTWFAKLPSEIGAKLSEAWGKITDFFSVSEWKKKVEGAIKAIKDNFKMPSFPRVKLTVEWDTKVSGMKKLVVDALGLDGWPKLNWSTYAQGGFPSMGEMFIAREAGPELVGRIGAKSTVANNDQIVTAVAQGVYSAVLSAMSESNNGGQNVNVYLDSKQIHASVKRTDESRGRNIMGNQLGYLY